MEEHLRSGLSLKAFGQQHNLDRRTVIRRLKQRQNLSAQPAQPRSWVRVELAPEPDAVSVGAPSGVALVLAGRPCIELACHLDAGTPRQLLRLLESPASVFASSAATLLYLALGATRLRQGFDGLYALVRKRLAPASRG